MLNSNFDPHYPVLGSLKYEQANGSLYGQPDPQICRWLDLVVGGTVLDLAAGDGRYTPFLSRAERVIAADLDVSALCAIRQKCPLLVDKLQYAVFNLFAPLPLSGASIDVMLCTGLLYVFPVAKLRSVFNEVWRITRTGGLFIFDFATEVERMWLDSQQPVNTLSETKYSLEEGKEAIRELLESSGFEIAELTTTRIDEVLPAGYHIANQKINVRALKTLRDEPPSG